MRLVILNKSIRLYFTLNLIVLWGLLMFGIISLSKRILEDQIMNNSTSKKAAFKRMHTNWETACIAHGMSSKEAQFYQQRMAMALFDQGKE